MANETDVRRDLALGNFRLSVHAMDRFNERGITTNDIRKCAEDALIDERADGRFEVDGLGMDNEDLKFICVYDPDLLIVTAF